MAAENRFALIAWPLFPVYHLLALGVMARAGGVGLTTLIDVDEALRALVIGGVAAFSTTFVESRALRSAALVIIPFLLGPLYWLASTLLKHLGPRFPLASALSLVALQWLVVGIAVVLTMRLVPERKRDRRQN